MSIQNILRSINLGYENVTDLIPTKFNFNDYPNYFTTSLNDWPEAYAVCVQSDGKVLVAGYSGLYDQANDFNYSIIKRFNTDGSLDTNFTSPVFDNDINDIKQQSSGKLIVVGSFNNVGTSYGTLIGTNCIVRLSTSGTVDNTFVIGDGFDNYCYVCNVLEDNSIIVGGEFNQYDGSNSSCLAKLDINGSLNS